MLSKARIVLTLVINLLCHPLDLVHLPIILILDLHNIICTLLQFLQSRNFKIGSRVCVNALAVKMARNLQIVQHQGPQMSQEILDYLLLVENMVCQHRMVEEMIADGTIEAFDDL